MNAHVKEREKLKSVNLKDSPPLFTKIETACNVAASLRVVHVIGEPATRSLQV